MNTLTQDELKMKSIWAHFGVHDFEVILVSMKAISIRIDSETLDKLHYVADYEGRSANSQVRILIRDCIEKFEREHGKIFEDKK